jgi:hypothetical protein
VANQCDLQVRHDLEAQAVLETHRSHMPEDAAFTDCIPCLATGVCLACKASGKSGYFLRPPSASTPACRHCRGTGRCRTCGGEGKLKKPTFRPYIYVEASLHSPTSITAAIWGGTGHRRIEIPTAVLQRSSDGQRGWGTWRTRKHFRDNAGKCFLFGDIIGYAWFQSRDRGVRFDTRGGVIGTREWVPSSTSGSVTIRNKTITASERGLLMDLAVLSATPGGSD